LPSTVASRQLVASPTELTAGLVPGVIYSLRQNPTLDSHSGLEPRLWGLRLHTPSSVYAMDSRFEQFVQLTHSFATNDPPLCQNKGRNFFDSNHEHTLFSHKNEDKSNEVSLNNLRFSQYNLGLVRHTIYSRIFHSCYLLLLFSLLHFPPLQFYPYRIFYSRIFSLPCRTQPEYRASPINRKQAYYRFLYRNCANNELSYFSVTSELLPINGIMHNAVFVLHHLLEDRGYNTIKHCDKTAKTKSTTVDCFSVLALLQLLHVLATTLR